MENKRIIYPNNFGGVSVIIPIQNNAINPTTGEWYPLRVNEMPPDGYRLATVEEIAAKDVPPGKPYRIVDVSDIPTDRSLRDAWEYDDGN